MRTMIGAMDQGYNQLCTIDYGWMSLCTPKSLATITFILCVYIIDHMIPIIGALLVYVGIPTRVIGILIFLYILGEFILFLQKLKNQYCNLSNYMIQYILSEKVTCSCGGIGIRARLRIQSGITGYGFKSRQLHYMKRIKPKGLVLFSLCKFGT